MTGGRAGHPTRTCLARAAGVLALALVVVLPACTHSRIVKRNDSSGSQGYVRTPPRPAPASLPSGAMHTVARGETLYGISFRYGLRFQDVAAWNGIGEPYVIRVGQRLRLRPSGAMASARPRTATPPRGSLRSQPGSVRNGVATPNVAQAPGPSSTPTPAHGAASTIAMPPIAGPGPAWRWPTQGQVIGRYVSGDQTQQGINVAGDAGQAVLAAADGVVVYSGAGLVGYGELIIIKHSEEWLSAYAHNRRRLVNEGARVRAGESIAEMGRTGAIRDMLHFEIRHNGKPVDPLALLPRR